MNPAPFTLWTLSVFDGTPFNLWSRFSPRTAAVLLDPTCLHYDTYSGKTLASRKLMAEAAAYTKDYHIT